MRLLASQLVQSGQEVEQEVEADSGILTISTNSSPLLSYQPDQFCLAFTNFTGREHQGVAGLQPVRIQFYVCHEAQTFEFAPIQLSYLGIFCCELRVRQLLLGLPAELGLPVDGDPAAPDRHAGPRLPLPPDDARLPCVGRNLLHLHCSNTGK